MDLQALYELKARSSLEPEIKLLLRQLLELVDNGASPDAVVCAGDYASFAGDNQARDEIVLKFEHRGAQYKLVKSDIPPEYHQCLSPREQEIVRLVSIGHPNKTIALKLAISQHTVNTHVRRIFGKLGVSSRAEMVAFAMQTGLLRGQVNHYN